MATVTDLISVLQRNGVTSGADLARLLEVSPATLHRLVRAAGGQVLRLGRTRGARYGLLAQVPQVGPELPVWRVNESGQTEQAGVVYVLHGHAFWLEFIRREERSARPGHLYEGIPPFFADMAPQGYLGRAFAEHHADLNLPDRIADWSAEHVVRAVARRGDDASGNLVIGSESMDRFLRRAPTVTDADSYPAITRDLARQAAGSSAAGEFPKFAAFDGRQHLIVKFTSGDGSPQDQRWRDLLVCESIAAAVLRAAGHAAVETQIRDVGTQRFLEITRFDRVGASGRRGTLTLAAVNDDLYGQRDNWVTAAGRLQRDGFLAEEGLESIRFLEAFGLLIGNTDRHFGNITFFWDLTGAWQSSLRVTPAYDMLPMAFAPATGGMVVERRYDRPDATSATLAAWPTALACARTFWDAVQRDKRVSAPFRDIAASAADAVR